MILEYLVKGEENADACVAIIMPTKATAEKKLLKTDHYIITASIDGVSDDSAKVLSKIHENVIASVQCTILTEESSEYYDRILFPVINAFERKLRKLLYSASILSSEEGSQIVDLETKDFGQLFDLLFLDSKYQNSVKGFVNGQKTGRNAGWHGFAGELKIFLAEENENPLWDKLLPEQVPTLREHFSEVQRYRNDVMHAHNISRRDYLQIKRLFENINSEIDTAIEALAGGAFISDTYNEDLRSAITFFETHDGEIVTDHEGNPLVFR